MSTAKPLKRSLSLAQMILYGIGTTVGAGIYALIGEIAEVSGYFAIWSFLLAALLAGIPAYSFAQLCARYPRSAGAALYVQQAFTAPRLAQFVGLLVIAAGIISAAALLNGFVGYLQTFISLDRGLIIMLACIVLCLIATWGIAESVWIAGTISVIEVLGLLWVSALAIQSTEIGTVQIDLFIPDTSIQSWSLILTGSVLAFYAYIGFEDMVEVAEEVNDVSKTLPRAIMLTLGISSIIYVVLVTSTLIAVGPQTLANSDAPLADVYRKLTSEEPILISFIGLFAIINGALIQIIMASRVIYGLSKRHQLPQILSHVNATTQTPVTATIVATLGVLSIALAGNLAGLAELTSVAMLSVFALVNFSLCRLAWSDTKFKRLQG